MATSWTLALIKPDAVKAGNADEIKQLIELHGFTIIIQQKFQVCCLGCT
jgi:nucleoside diphosphate kinase